MTPGQAGAPAFSRGAVQPAVGVAVISDVNVMAGDFQDIRVNSWFTTIERELARSLALSVTYQGNRASNLPLSRNVNLSAAGTLPDGRPRYSTTNRPDPRYGNIFVAESIGDQRYDGLVTVLTKRFSKGTSFQLSHHVSKSRGLSFVNDFTGFGIFTSPSDPVNPEIDRGPSDFDMRQRFSATLLAETQTGLTGSLGALINGWQLSSRIIASDGFRFDATTGQDGNGDTIFNDRPTGQSYNTFEHPAYVTVDMRFARLLGLGGTRQVELIVEGFNLFNRLNGTGVNRTWGPNETANANFNTLTGAETARQFQLAARFSF